MTFQPSITADGIIHGTPVFSGLADHFASGIIIDPNFHGDSHMTVDTHFHGDECMVIDPNFHGGSHFPVGVPIAGPGHGHGHVLPMPPSGHGCHSGPVAQG